MYTNEIGDKMCKIYRRNRNIKTNLQIVQKTKNSSRHTEKPNSLQVLQGTADSGAQTTVNNSPSPWPKSSKLEILCLLLSTL